MNDAKSTDNLKLYDTDHLMPSYTILMKTSRGEMKFNLFPKDAPQACANFLHLIENNFYNGLKFHRVIAGFVAQGGCPHGSGFGGPGWKIKCDLGKSKHTKGALSMAHAGRDTGGSQFFICFESLPHLDGEHTVFGETKDFDVLDSIKQNDEILSIQILNE